MKRTLLIILLVLVLCTSGSFIARALNMSGVALSGLAILIESIAAAITVRNPSSSITVTDVTTIVSPTVKDEGAGAASVSGIFSSATFPVAPALYDTFWLTSDGGGLCEEGTGSLVTLCVLMPEGWEPVIPVPLFTETDTFQSVVSRGATVTSAIFSTPVLIGGSTHSWRMYQDGTGSLKQRACTNDGATCTTSKKELELSSDWELVNENGTTCGSFDSITMAWTPSFGGTCVPNLIYGATASQGLVATQGQLGLKDCAAGQVLQRNAGDTDWECVTPAAGGGGGGLNTPIIASSTDVHNMVAGDCGKTIVNADGDTLTVNLIADPTGCIVCFFEESVGTIKLEPSGTDKFIVAGLTPTDGDSITLGSSLGNNICLQGKDTSIWYVLLGTGSVTDTN